MLRAAIQKQDSYFLYVHEGPLDVNVAIYDGLRAALNRCVTVCTVRIATVPTAHAPDNKMDACFEEMLCEEICRCPHVYKSSLKEYKGSQMALNSWRVCVQYNNRMKKLNFPLQDQVDYRTVLNCNLMSLFAPPSRHRGHSVRTSTL